jgi:hydroxymethylpyrimidine/phosphomethylpyrimidine kinase
MSFSPPCVLAFAASDPSGGAGVQADLLTLSALGCHALSVVTALTVQDTRGVHDVLPIPARWVAEQARCVLDDIAAAAFKLGVLGSAENVHAVAGAVSAHAELPLVVDPVLASGRGDVLAAEDTIEALRRLVFPRTTVLTPNSIEAQRLGGVERILRTGCRYVLVTGTHQPGADVVNVLYSAHGVVRTDRWPRLPESYHGSGCTLAAALAAALAKGHPVADAAHEAQAYVWQALHAGFRPGGGQFIPNRFARP